MKLSKIYKVEHRRFRYNYDNALLCWIDENGEAIAETTGRKTREDGARNIPQGLMKN